MSQRGEMMVSVERWEPKTPFRISGRILEVSGIVCVSLSDGRYTGYGEGWPFSRFGQTVEASLAELESVREQVQQGLSRDALLDVLPAGAARNALDCALWDLEAKQQQTTVWQLAGLPAPATLVTAVTLSLDTPDKMAQAARQRAGCPLFKIKLGESGDMERLRAIRQAAPDTRLVVDVNEGWSLAQLKDNMPTLVELGIEMIEQPLPAADDAALAGYQSPIPISADERCHTTQDLPGLLGRYQMVTIKLDKTGGLTEALRLAQEAKALGLGLMVGCMLGTSRAMAAGYVVGSLCKIVDLDAPLHLAGDRDHAMHYNQGRVSSFTSQLWG